MSVSARTSVEEYLDGDWPPNSQLIEGEVVVNDPTVLHQRAAGAIYLRLASWCEGAPGRGETGWGCNWVAGLGDNVYKPDVWWVSDEHRPADDALWVPGVPDLAVEVRSPSTWRHDTGAKRQVYEAAGAGELWLVDPSARRITVLRRSVTGGPGFDVTVEVGVGEEMTSPLLPGFEVKVEMLLR